jgi:hypothetical protein
MLAVQPFDFDLNQPLEPLDDDLSIVDDLEAIEQNPPLNIEPMEEDIIVAISDFQGVEAPLPPLAEEVPDANVFIPMDNDIPSS